MEDILKNTDKLKGKQKENIEKYSKQAEISKYLATIVRDMSLDFALEDFSHKEPDYDRLIDLFRELEFYSLINRIQLPRSMESEIEETTDIKNMDNLKKLADKIKSIKTFSVLIDADKKDFTSYKIKGLYLAVEDKSYYIEYKLLEKDSTVKTILKSIFEDDNIYKVTHDGKYARNVLRQLDIDFMCQFDTMLAAYLLEPSKPRYDISTLTLEYLGKSLSQTSGLGDKAAYLFALKEGMTERIKDCDMESLFYDVELPLSVVLADMEHTGISINPNKLQELSDKFGKKLASLTEDIYNQAGTEFNINSPKQLGEVLFERLSLPVIKRTKTGFSTDAEVLEKLRPSHPIVENILEYRF